MKKILVINPIATDKWNDLDRKFLQKSADQDTVIDIVSLNKGPQTIEFFRDIAFANPAILQIAEKYKRGYDGIMVNCFADPGLMVLREACDLPITAPCESSLVVALLLGHQFSVIGTKGNLYPLFEMKCLKMGLLEKLSSFQDINLHVKQLEEDSDITIIKIVDKINQAVGNGAGTAILGCTGMAPFYPEIKKRVKIPVIEPATSALKMLEDLIDMGMIIK